MTRYVIRRLLIAIPVVICVAFLIFTLLYFTPGDPARTILGSGSTEEDLRAFRDYVGLNDSYFVRLGHFMQGVFLKFDLGQSWKFSTNVTFEISYRLPRTIGVCVYSVLISAVLGIPLGVVAAVHQDGIADKIVLVGSSVMRCVPNFWVAQILVLIFAVKLRWLKNTGVDEGLASYILPCVSIMVGSFAWTSRQMRSSMLEVIRSDYVTAARAQGFSKNVVYYAHALPNALIPIITVMGTQLAVGLGGTIILESYFSIPGMGNLLQSGLNNRDFPVVSGTVTFLAITFSLIMILVDVCYAIADPRIRAQYEERAKGKRRVKNSKRRLQA